jgi:hypothetical protein
MAPPNCTSLYDLLKVIEDVIRSADREKRDTLAATFDNYAEENPNEFFWATGAQAPALLHHIMLTIDSACRPDDEQGQHRGHIIRLIKPSRS